MKWTGHSDYAAMKPYIDIADKAKKEAMSLFDKKNPSKQKQKNKISINSILFPFKPIFSPSDGILPVGRGIYHPIKKKNDLRAFLDEIQHKHPNNARGDLPGCR